MKLPWYSFCNILLSNYRNILKQDRAMYCNVRNANYERVVSVMDRYLKEKYKNVCKCPRCISDIAALALNYLPPHYYVEFESEREIGSPWVMIETAVVEAIDRVIENPNHPPHESSSAAPSNDNPAIIS